MYSRQGKADNFIVHIASNKFEAIVGTPDKAHVFGQVYFFGFKANFIGWRVGAHHVGSSVRIFKGDLMLTLSSFKNHIGCHYNLRRRDIVTVLLDLY